VYRIVWADQWATNLHLVSGVNAGERGGRWNPGGLQVRTCYTSEHVSTAVAERLHYATQIIPDEIISRGVRVLPDDFWDSFLMGAVEVELECLDFSSDQVVREINKVCNFNHGTMIREWLKEAERGETLLQAIGRASMEIGIQGLRVPSARHLGSFNLVIFPTNVHNPDHGRLFVNEIGAVPSEFHRFI